MIYEITEPQNAVPLFQGWQETLIWSCLQKVMGKLYGDSPEQPTSAMALLGDFSFFAGETKRELVLYKPECCTGEFMIMVPQNEKWADLIKTCYGEKAKRITRYAIKKQPDVFDRTTLEKAVDALPKEYSLQMMDKDLFYRCKRTNWCRDWVSQYSDYECYEKNGLGVVILQNGELVSGASSYSGYRGGIEIEIDTKEAYRRKGLAYICGAKLILECLDRGWYPSWDAQNKWSVALAQKLGYHLDHEYVAFEVSGW